MFSRNRWIALFLMLTWILLSAGPIAYAATGKCCPACNDHMCPMKKQPKKTMSCHESMPQESCKLQAGACNRELDGLVFSFLGIIPAFIWLPKDQIAKFATRTIRALIPEELHTDTPPPKPRFAC